MKLSPVFSMGHDAGRGRALGLPSQDMEGSRPGFRVLQNIVSAPMSIVTFSFLLQPTSVTLYHPFLFGTARHGGHQD